MTGVLHTARINAIEVIVSSDKLIKMVNFKLGMKCEGDSQTSRGGSSLSQQLADFEKAVYCR